MDFPLGLPRLGGGLAVSTLDLPATHLALQPCPLPSCDPPSPVPHSFIQCSLVACSVPRDSAVNSQLRPCPRVQSPAEHCKCSWSPSICLPSLPPPTALPSRQDSLSLPRPIHLIHWGQRNFPGVQFRPQHSLSSLAVPAGGSLAPGLRKHPPLSFPGVTLLHRRLCPHTFLLLGFCFFCPPCLECYSSPRCSPR